MTDISLRHSKVRKWLLAILAPLILLGLPLGGYILFTIATGNFHEVVKGQVYRSAQLNPAELHGKIDTYGIKSVLNLRGKNTGKDWYDQELAACANKGVIHYDIPLSAGKDVSFKRLNELVSILKNAPKPLLIHCKSGADRTALGSALYHLAIERKLPEVSDDELTIWYGHIPIITPHVLAMDRSFQCYAEFLKDHRVNTK